VSPQQSRGFVFAKQNDISPTVHEFAFFVLRKNIAREARKIFSVSPQQLRGICFVQSKNKTVLPSFRPAVLQLQDEDRMALYAIRNKDSLRSNLSDRMALYILATVFLAKISALLKIPGPLN